MNGTTDQDQILIVPDTSAILDIARAPVRFGHHNTDLQPVQEILSDDNIHLGLLDVVENEYKHNIDGVAENARSDLLNLERKVKHAELIDSNLVVPAMTPLPGGWSERLIGATTQLANTVCDVAELIPTTEADLIKAHNRGSGRRPPARQGSAAINDCIITEATLRIADQRNEGSTVLVTSNVKDFCDGLTLKPELSEEFAAVGLRFFTSWRQMRYELL